VGRVRVSFFLRLFNTSLISVDGTPESWKLGPVLAWVWRTGPISLPGGSCSMWAMVAYEPL
jgi:hypothetical protein